MTDVTVHEIQNEVDQMQYTIYTEWNNESIKVILLQSDRVPLMGVMSSEEINYYSNEHSKSYNEYVQETKDIFSGKVIEVKFFLRDKEFEWKRKMWILGKLHLSLLDQTNLMKTLYSLVKYQQRLQENLINLLNENKDLKNLEKKSRAIVENIIKVKTNLEKDLYKKFLLVLNTKKRRIQELENQLNIKEGTEQSVFDADTDKSDFEDKRIGSSNSLIGSTNSKMTKDVNVNRTINIISEYEETDTNVPSKRETSSNNAFIKDFVSSSESECELELKINESYSTDKPSTSRLDFTEESEEELF